MSLRGTKAKLTALSVIAVLFGLAGAIGPASAHIVTGCTVIGGSTITIPSGGSVVVQIKVTYEDFSSGDWPMKVTVNPISAGFSSSTASYSDGSAGTYTFSVQITNTNPAVTSGTGTISVVWAEGSSDACGSLTLKTVSFSPVPEFPFGMALLMALAMPVLLLSRRFLVRTAV